MGMAIIENPKFRLAISSLLTVGVSVFSSIFATDIYKSGSIEWSSFYKTESFLWLFGVIVVWIFAQIYYLKQDEKILAFNDDAFCRAHIRKTKLEALAVQVKKDPEKAHLIKASTFLKDLGVQQS